MNCKNCNRELKDDSNFCDFCGTIVEKSEKPQSYKKVFNVRLLILGILASILITLLIIGIAKKTGMPFLFGGLFLPFFWRFKTTKHD